MIDQGADLDTWARDNPKGLAKRKGALEKARAQLTGPQPARKRLKPPARTSCDLLVGDVLALDLAGGLVLIRTVHVASHRGGETPTLEELDFNGPQVPAAEVIRQLPAKTGDDARFTAMFDAGWKEAGFQKVANVPVRSGDELLADQSCGFVWSGLAVMYRERRAGLFSQLT